MLYNRRKNLFVAMILSVSVLILCGCGGMTGEVAEEAKEDDMISIGISFDSFLIERWERDRDVFVTTAKDAGVDVNVQNANGDADTQINQIRYLIGKGVDAIVIVAVDSDKLSGVISEAKDRNIKVIAYDRMLKNADCDLYVSFDNREVGELMAQALAESETKVKNVYMLSGPTEDDNVTKVNEGFEKVCEKNGIKIIDTFYTKGWKPENAYEFLNENQDILDSADALMCGNDGIATQVVRFLAERRRAGQILVTGQDADLEACQRIVQGTQLVTVYKPVEKEAKAAANATIAMINGEKITGLTGTENDGTYDVPAIVLDPLAVTRDNIDSIIIGSGFHTHDEVYLYTSATEND